MRDAEKGPLEVDAMTVVVRAKQEGRVGPEERWVVIRNGGESRIDYALSNAGADVPLIELVPDRGNGLSRKLEPPYLARSLDCEEIDQWQGRPQK